MLRNWVEILPLFVVRIIARRSCERVKLGNTTCIQALKDVLFVESK